MFRRLLHKINRFNMKIFDPCRVNALTSTYLIKILEILINSKEDIFQQKRIRIERLLECGFFFSQRKLFRVISFESSSVFYNILCNIFQLRLTHAQENCQRRLHFSQLIEDSINNDTISFETNETILCLNIVKFTLLSEEPFKKAFALRNGEEIKMYLLKLQLLIQSIEFQIGFIKEEDLQRLYSTKLRKIKSLGFDCVLKIQRTQFKEVIYNINELL